jgi:hypothetical protein
VHGPLAAAVDPVEAERIVQVMLGDARFDQRRCALVEPALPASIASHDADIGHPLESIDGNDHGSGRDLLSCSHSPVTR